MHSGEEVIFINYILALAPKHKFLTSVFQVMGSVIARESKKERTTSAILSEVKKLSRGI